MKLHHLFYLSMLICPGTQTTYYAINLDPAITEIPSDIPNNVTKVIINFNSLLEVINDYSFFNNTELIVANLNNNKISFISPLTFSGTSLEELYLYNNALAYVPSLIAVPTLSILDIGLNRISGLYMAELMLYGNLTELHVSRNTVAWTHSALAGINEAANTLLTLDLSRTDGPIL